VKIVTHHAEVNPPNTSFEIKIRTHQAEGTFINVRFRASHSLRKGYRNYLRHS